MANKVGPGGMTPLHYAAQNGHAAATALLLGLGADVDGRTSQERSKDTEKSERASCGATPLHRAAFSGAVSAMQVLLEWNGVNNGGGGSDEEAGKTQCDLLAKDSSFGDMMTPLHKAAAGGRPLSVQLLVVTLRNRRCTARISDDDSASISTLRQGLMAQDSQGRTPLDVARSIDPAKEEKSVRRWDNVAGGRPDWEQCINILENAEKEIGLAATLKTEKLPTLPKHLLDAASCLECGAEDGVCYTSTWKAAFHSALSSSANRAGAPGETTDRGWKEVSKKAERVNDHTDPKGNTSASQNGSKVIDNIGAITSQSLGNENPSARSAYSNTRVGVSCSSCGDHSLSLFRENGGGLVCNKCRASTRRSNIITVAKM